MVPVAFTSYMMHNGQALQRYNFGNFSIYAIQPALMFEDHKNLRLCEGKVIVESDRDGIVELGKVKLQLHGHVVAQIERSAEGISITNLFDSNPNGVKVCTTGADKIHIHLGEEIIIGQLTTRPSVPGRRHASLASFIPLATIREISIPFLLTNDKLVRLYASSNPKAYQSMLRASVSLQMIQVSHGAYR